MNNYRTTIAATLAILTAALLAGPAQAGASASAASKNSQATATKVASAAQLRADRQARREVGITEYSSSSAKKH